MEQWRGVCQRGSRWSAAPSGSGPNPRHLSEVRDRGARLERVQLRLGPPALGLVVAGLVVFAGCGDIDGTQEPFAGTVRYQDLQGRFELRLLVPPWVPIPPVTGDVTIFVVMPDTITMNSKESDARYSLDVSTVGGDAASALKAAAVGPPAWDASHAQPVRTTSG